MRLTLPLVCLGAAITGLVPRVAGSASAAALPARTAATSTVNWPGFHGYPAGTGYNPDETTIGTGKVASLQQISGREPDRIVPYLAAPFPLR